MYKIIGYRTFPPEVRVKVIPHDPDTIIAEKKIAKNSTQKSQAKPGFRIQREKSLNAKKHGSYILNEKGKGKGTKSKIVF